MSKHIAGEELLIRFEQVLVRCRILSVVNRYGRDRLQVQPLDGDGKQWVLTERVVEEPICKSSTISA